MSYLLRGATDVCTSNAVTLTVDAPHSTPCRRCLTDAEPGERVLLVSHDPFDVDSPYLIIVAGERRRFKAAQQVGLSTVPGICVEASTQPGWVGAGKQVQIS
jgi:hypothetical protein